MGKGEGSGNSRRDKQLLQKQVSVPLRHIGRILDTMSEQFSEATGTGGRLERALAKVEADVRLNKSWAEAEGPIDHALMHLCLRPESEVRLLAEIFNRLKHPLVKLGVLSGKRMAEGAERITLESAFKSLAEYARNGEEEVGLQSVCGVLVALEPEGSYGRNFMARMVADAGQEQQAKLVDIDFRKLNSISAEFLEVYRLIYQVYAALNRLTKRC